ncbi:MAG: Calx-beta domain-containing protein [Burkholderiales bacterium]
MKKEVVLESGLPGALWLAHALCCALLLAICMVIAPSSAQAQTVVRGPYLQSATPTSIVVRWRTSVATDSRVRYGASATSLTASAGSTVSATEHAVTLTGLAPATKYFYSVGSSTASLAGGDSTHFFITPPSVGAVQPTRIWVIGDAGENSTGQRQVRDAYLARTGANYTHLWLMLGDNAYDSGTDAEYQAAVFNIYPTLLRQSVVWPTLGNHDGATANSSTQTGPYYDIFTLPRNGEAGGVPSNTEAYYSFDYANIHFVVLDSFETNRASNGAMLNWLRQDLAATRQKWIIAFWHHPPYSKGSHDSDSETELVQMRANALPIFEDFGVDLVLTGHSHAYERSFQIDGHYGSSSTFNPATMQVNGGAGPYERVTDGSVPGALYAVAGSSGSVSGSGSLNHPVMYTSVRELGSMVLDINGDTLDAVFINNTGTVRDSFRMVKTVGLPSVTVSATDATATEAGLTTGTYSVTRTGSTTAPLTVTYSMSGSATQGSDYSALTGSVTIPAGAAAATITLVPINDALLEPTETAILTLSANAAYRTGTPGSATITIASDEQPPTVSITASDSLATEAGPTTGTFTVSRTGDATAPLTASLTVGGTATSGSDYTALPASVTIPAGSASVLVTVTPVNDTLVEADETVVLSLASSANYTVGTASATITIASDDAAPASVSVAATDASATEAGPTTGTFTITRTGATTAALAVNYTMSGTATAGSDYLSLSGSVTIPAGAASATVTITPVNDTLVESNETVVLTLANASTYTVGTASATVTLTSDDVAPATVNVTASDASATEAGPTTGTFTVSRTGDATAPLTASLAVGGTATSGGDYTALPASVTIPAGAASVAVTVTPVNDTLVEGDETVVLSLASSANYTVGTASATVTITSDDIAPASVSVAATDASATEAGPTTGAFTVTRTGATTAALSVNYTMSGTATAGSDYLSPSGSVTIPAGAASATVTITPVNDTLLESNETVVLTLAAGVAYSTGSPASATVTITSDEVAPTVSVAAADSSAAESPLDTGVFRIARTGATTSALTVGFSMSGTATNGADYVSLPASITIPAGSASVQATVTPINDTLIESGETVVLTLFTGTGYALGTPASASVTLTSEDGSIPTPANHIVSRVFDNKNGKAYWTGGPDGSEPADDLRSMTFDPLKIEVEAGATYWWEAEYQDPAATAVHPTVVKVIIDNRPEEDWSGSFTAEARIGTTLLASVQLPVNGNKDPVTGKGTRTRYEWDLSALVKTREGLAGLKLRLINNARNGKKVWAVYSVTQSNSQ